MRNHGQAEKLGEVSRPEVSRSLPGRSLFGALLLAAWCAHGTGIALAADGAALFEAKCAACHSVGGGPKVGPDLKGVVARRGKEGATLAIFDPAKAGLGPNMPKLGLTQSEAAAVSAYLEGAETGAGKAPDAQAQAAAEATPEEIGLGQKLFKGSVRFANGGPACNACHHVNHDAVTGGGNLAADLSLSFSRVGKQGLTAMLANAPFPVMQSAYEGRPISAEEVRALAGFLQQAEKENASQQTGDHGWNMFFGGAGGVLVLAGLFSLIGMGRKKHCVNQDIYDRQLESE